MTVQEHETCYDPRLISRGETDRDALRVHKRGLDIPSVMFVFLGLKFEKITRKHPGQ